MQEPSDNRAQVVELRLSFWDGARFSAGLASGILMLPALPLVALMQGVLAHRRRHPAGWRQASP